MSDQLPSAEYRNTTQKYRELPQSAYGGYYKAKRPEEDTELTRVAPGTPCGEFFRRFWIPVAMTQEIKDVPLRLRILGEDLVVFCDKSGSYGLLHLHCSHRNASLEFGVVEQCGLRCCYHGWLYDVDGTILETPGEPEDSRRKESVMHGAYPVKEYHGLIFAYMGPPEHKPDFPYFDTTMLPDVELVPYSIDYPCNWLQVAENTMDPYHTVFLHARVTDVHFGSTWNIMPEVEFYELDEKVYSTLTYRIDDMIWVRTQETFLPSFSQVGAFWEEGRDEKYFVRASITKWTIPHDDENCMIIAWRSFGPGIDPDGIHGDREMCGKQSVDFEGQTGVESYEYRQRHPNDYEAQVYQGKINSHAAENLANTDKGIAYLRRSLRKGIRTVSNGGNPAATKRVDDEWLTHVQDTVLPIPKRDDIEDKELLHNVANAVKQIVFDADEFNGQKRIDFLKSRLRELKTDKRFIA